MERARMRPLTFALPRSLQPPARGAGALSPHGGEKEAAQTLCASARPNRLWTVQKPGTRPATGSHRTSGPLGTEFT